MSGQKRKRLTPGLSGFTKVGAGEGQNQAGLDPLSLPSFSGASAAFACETPTLAPVPAPIPSHAGAAPKLYRFSPRVSASTGIFNSPMFSVQTPVFEYQSAPNVFHGSLLPPPFGAAAAGSGTGPAAPLHPDHLLSPVPFMESPYAHHDLRHPRHHHHQQQPQQQQQQPPPQQQQQKQMENPPCLSLTGAQPQNSVLERFRKFFDNQGGPVDFGSPSICAVSQSVGDAFSLGMPFQHDVVPPSSQHEVPAPPVAADDEDVSSGDSNDLLSPSSANPELSESLLRSGSSCHQCKSRRMQGYLSFCSGAKAKRKSCRKKYCDACLAKFYQMQPSRSRSAREQTVWSCPSCCGICCCAACRRSKVQQQTTAASRVQLQQRLAKTPELYSPATSMAVGLVYFGDFDLLDGSVPIQLPPPAVPTEPPRPRAADSLAFGPLH